MKFICTLLTVSDIEKSKHFYETVLGQKLKTDFGENISFEGDFALHLRSHFQELIDNKKTERGANDVELYFEDDEVDLIVKKLKENKVQFVHELREQPWRQKVVRFYDPDKYIIEIGESMEHVAYRLHLEGKNNEEIAKITYLPIEVVKISIQKYTQE
jgi:catechol 2,3-dioxygenase-like lactoylglutathione lyase family enzyme